MDTPNYENTGLGREEYLSSKEKFTELQRQDWQIEGLIVGSIIFGLMEIPDLLDSNALSFYFWFPTGTIDSFFAIVFFSTTILLMHLIVLLIYRIFWVVEAFSSNPNVKRLFVLNENSGSHLSFGFRWFLFILINAPFSFYIFLIIGSLLEIEKILCWLPLISFMALYFHNFMSLAIFNSKKPKYIKRTKLFFILFNPLSFFIMKIKIFHFESLFPSLILFSSNYENNNLKEGKVKNFNALVLGISVFLTVIFYVFLSNLMSNINRIEITSKLIKANGEIQVNGFTELHIDERILPLNSKTINASNFDSIHQYNRANIFDLSKITLLINKKPLKLEWYHYSSREGAGIKSYLELKNLQHGVNDLELSITSFNRKYTQNFSFYKPYEN